MWLIKNRAFKIVVFLFFSFSSSLADSVVQTVSEDSSRFPGFRSGQYGWGGMIGQPMSVRYQKWFHWKRAWFSDLGYQLDEFLVTDVNYSFYHLSEDDRWKMNRKVGTVFFSSFLGVGAAIYLGRDKEEEPRLGIRGGGAFEYLLPNSFWSIRLEVAPILYLSGRTAAGVQGGIVLIRYFDSTSPRPTPTPLVEETDDRNDQRLMPKKIKRSFSPSRLPSSSPPPKKAPPAEPQQQKKRENKTIKKIINRPVEKKTDKKSYRIEKFNEDNSSGGENQQDAEF